MELEERLRRANGSAKELSTILYDPSEEVLVVLLDNPQLTEDHLKVLLSRKNLSQTFLRELAGRERLWRSYPVKLALVRHPHAPRSKSLALVRHLYLFDLLKVATTPGVPMELRRGAEEAVVARVPALSLGERLSLARQGSSRIASALLADSETRVFRTVLENPRLTQEGVLKSLADERLTPEVVGYIAEHPRWSLRYEVRLALIRHPGDLAEACAGAGPAGSEERLGGPDRRPTHARQPPALPDAPGTLRQGPACQPPAGASSVAGPGESR